MTDLKIIRANFLVMKTKDAKVLAINRICVNVCMIFPFVVKSIIPRLRARF